ncbi:peptidase M16 [Calothrix sp. 336/3]|nr:peptidase M16 [Calothrix sp. 336/3]
MSQKSVFSTLRRYFVSFFLLILWLIAVFILHDGSAYSQLRADATEVNTLVSEVAQSTTNTSVTGNVRKTLLKNGLTVLTKEVHAAPVVTVQVWYKVGSRNEEAGINGIAHQLEHMLFKGTKSRPIQFGRLFSALGSDSNAFTSYDQTAYYGTAERDKLDALLLLEADRMQNSLIDAQQLVSEKRVVISELQGYENSSEYRLSRAVMQAAFPHHPYGLPVGGTKSDVEKFPVAQVRKYYRNFYSPNNAVLIVVGDFDTNQLLRKVEKTFAKIPKSGNISQVRQKISSTAKINTPIILKEPGAGALIHGVYPVPDVNHPDIPLLDVMNYILTEGRNSRLYQALVESGLASGVNGSVMSLLDGGWYEISLTASANEDLVKIDQVLQEAIANFQEIGVTEEEVKRAKKQLEASMILNNRDITSQAMQLGTDETTAGDYRYSDRYLTQVRQVQAKDVQRVAQQYLIATARTVGYFQPNQQQSQQVNINKNKTTQIAESFSSEAPENPREVFRYLPPLDRKNVTTIQSLPQQFNLPNGIRVLLLPDKSTPTVTLSGYIKAGTEFDPEEKSGLASLVTDNLMNGTTTQDAFTITKTLEERGANLKFNTYREGVEIQGSTLAGDLPILLQSLADVVQNSVFPTQELEISRHKAITELKQELDNPSAVARRIFVQSVYPKKHPLHTFPTEKSLENISRQDVMAFYEKHYRPDTTVLSLVGDFSSTQVRSLILDFFGSWEATGKPPTLKYPAVNLPSKIIRMNPVLPGKAQAITYMGGAGISRQDPRYYAALVLNQIFGGDTLSSRLGVEVRDRQGLTYGIYSTFQVGKNNGTFLIEMQTAPEDATKAIASTRKLLRQIHRFGVSSNEVETAKNTLISNYNVSLANPEELAYRMAINEIYGLKNEELRHFTQKIKAVNLKQVNQAARELLHPDKIIVVTAGPQIIAETIQ